jgi:hypothetical protein
MPNKWEGRGRCNMKMSFGDREESIAPEKFKTDPHLVY